MRLMNVIPLKHVYKYKRVKLHMVHNQYLELRNLKLHFMKSKIFTFFDFELYLFEQFYLLP